VKPVVFLEPAEAELEEQVIYFDGQSPGLGDRFEQQVEHATRLIAEYSQIGEPVTKKVRKFRVQDFPFNIIYVEAANESVVVAIAPHSRRPNYWRARLRFVR
jgi:toxin ParE1/3/4